MTIHRRLLVPLTSSDTFTSLFFTYLVNLEISPSISQTVLSLKVFTFSSK